MARNPKQTRQRLLEAAFEEIHNHGFQGMRVDEVLCKTGLQKGAFYHHFKSKIELGYAVLEEEVAPMLESIWLTPLETIQNPVTDLPRMLTELSGRIPDRIREHGCPLNNLAQEMSSQDKGFQIRIASQFNNWIETYTQLFEKAQANGYVRSDIKAEEIARFVIASLEGCISIFKVEQAPQQWQACQSQLELYLQGLQA
jgi:TetR/AcrR family transcriptional regulator, transcriptional repressor for nem operon